MNHERINFLVFSGFLVLGLMLVKQTVKVLKGEE